MPQFTINEENAYLRRLNEIGVALSSEHDLNTLLRMILDKALNISQADAGVFFIMDECGRQLLPRAMACESLGMEYTPSDTADLPEPLPLYFPDGAPHVESISAHAAITNRTLNIPDIYCDSAFDFASTKRFDDAHGYHTTSVLATPLSNRQGRVLGVLRLSNARNYRGEIIPFNQDMCEVIASLASQAAVALENDLLLEGMKTLLEAFIQMMAKAIDTKSPHTGNHLQKVPVIAEALAQAACDSNTPPFEDFSLTPEEMYESRIAAWLHDCGKLTTPDHILEKRTKLEGRFDNITLLETRMEVLLRDAEITYLRAVSEGKSETEARTQWEETTRHLQHCMKNLRDLNKGREHTAEPLRETLKETGKLEWCPRLATNAEQSVPFLTEDEHTRLSVIRGTLTEEDRRILQHHAQASLEMLRALPFPETLTRVPEYAGGHHEKMDGTGYPQGLTGAQMSLPARMMVIADIFEALTSHDRPYKRPLTLKETRRIMDTMTKEGKLDADLMRLFWNSGIWKPYAEEHLLPEQQEI